MRRAVLVYPDYLQEQTTWSALLIEHSVLGPQGDGEQGFKGLHPWNGLPVKPGRQLQSSPMLETSHSALSPQGPGAHRDTSGSSIGIQP